MTHDYLPGRGFRLSIARDQLEYLIERLKGIGEGESIGLADIKPVTGKARHCTRSQGPRRLLKIDTAKCVSVEKIRQPERDGAWILDSRRPEK